jgi:hypothetical protein
VPTPRGHDVQSNRAALSPVDRVRLFGCTTLILLIVAAFSARGQTPQRPRKDLMTMSMQDLMNVEVTSVSKKEQKMSEVAAAIYVITQEDIVLTCSEDSCQLYPCRKDEDLGVVFGDSRCHSISDIYPSPEESFRIICLVHNSSFVRRPRPH